MNQPKLQLSRSWVERALTPYLRYAFSHELAYDEDISPKVYAAIEFCMTKPDHPSDGSDLLLERICHAVDFRYKDLAPDLNFVTDDLETLAKWLIRYAQIKGPYELLGRMNIGSGAWQANEIARLEELRREAKKEKQNRPFIAPPPPQKAAPSEDQIDPRLVLAMPGQYVGSHLDGTLQVHVDQYFREQVRRDRDRGQMQPHAHSWLQQVQQAAGTSQLQPYSQQSSGFGWLPQQHHHQYLPFTPTHTPSYIQQLGQRQSPYVPPGRGEDSTNGYNMPAEGSFSTAFMSKSTPHLAGEQWQNHTPTSFQTPAPPIPSQQHMQHFPVQAPAAPIPQPSSNLAGIPMSDIAHLRGKDWSNAAEQRARDFRMHGVTGLNLHQHQNQSSPNDYPPASMYPVPNPSTQPSSSATIPFHSGIAAPLPDHIVIPHTQQSYQQTQDVKMQDRPEAGVAGFQNHPGFSNVTNSFQNWQYGAPMNPPSGQNRNMWG